MGKVIIDDRWLRCDKDGNPPDKRAKQALARAHDPLTAAVPDKCVLLQCLFSRLISIFPQCGRMVFPGLVIMQSVM